MTIFHITDFNMHMRQQLVESCETACNNCMQNKLIKRGIEVEIHCVAAESNEILLRWLCFYFAINSHYPILNYDMTVISVEYRNNKNWLICVCNMFIICNIFICSISIYDFITQSACGLIKRNEKYTIKYSKFKLTLNCIKWVLWQPQFQIFSWTFLKHYFHYFNFILIASSWKSSLIFLFHYLHFTILSCSLVVWSIFLYYYYLNALLTY